MVDSRLTGRKNTGNVVLTVAKRTVPVLGQVFSVLSLYNVSIAQNNLTHSHTKSSKSGGLGLDPTEPRPVLFVKES